jgi:c-di-GMP-binding flagellar brake protein YcgR
MADENNNTREHRRYPTDTVLGQFAYKVEATVVNLSLGGFAVKTATQLQVGRSYRFRLGNGGESVDLEGIVRWCRLSGTRKTKAGDVVPVYEAGIAFEGILTNTAKELRQFMQKNVIVDLKQRVFGRLKVGANDEVTLESNPGFVVHQLSSSGMLVETEVAPKPESVFKFEVELDKKKFISRGRVVYVTQTGAELAGLRYRVGVEFVDTSATQKKALERFIRLELDKDG